jgi:hypothetical protein
LTLEHIGYHRRFIKGYTTIIASMEWILKKSWEFAWNKKCQAFLDILKEKPLE